MRVVPLGMGTIFLPIFMMCSVFVNCRHHEAHVNNNHIVKTSISVNNFSGNNYHISSNTSTTNRNTTNKVEYDDNNNHVVSDKVTFSSSLPVNILDNHHSFQHQRSQNDYSSGENSSTRTETSHLDYKVYPFSLSSDTSDKKIENGRQKRTTNEVELKVSDSDNKNNANKNTNVNENEVVKEGENNVHDGDDDDDEETTTHVLTFYPLVNIQGVKKRKKKAKLGLLKLNFPTENSYERGPRHLFTTKSDLGATGVGPHYTVEYRTAQVDGIRIEDSEKGVTYEEHGVSTILADFSARIRLFGKDFTNFTVVKFVTQKQNRGEDCDDTPSSKTYTLSEISATNLTAIVNVIFSASKPDEYYFICVRENNSDVPWVHVGSDPWLRIRAYDRLLPLWIQAVLIVGLLCLSGLFAGLTLGLLALDTTDLKILSNTGSEQERNYAKTILPLRQRGNYLLCSLVLGNVLINSTLTILLDDLTTGLFAVMLSTAGIVVFGEIIPQAVCSRNGLAIGAKTVWITRFIMLITFPLSYTFSVLLDKILGEEIGLVYNREKLKELIAVTLEHNQLDTEEVNIISGALEMRKKTVEAIMTRLEDVFMLPIDGILDFELLSEIRKQGYSRIPVYENERSNIVSVLFTKDLVFVDPDDRIPLKTLAQFYNNVPYFVYSDTTLDIIFKEFKECRRGGHMAFVQRVDTSQEDKDPLRETIGLVTLEDVIEELIQCEIVDETDVWMDNRSKRRTSIHPKQDFSKFVEIRNSQKTICISPQLALATFQFLITVVEPFKSNYISESVLHRLLKKNILFRIPKPKDKNKVLIYESGKPTDCFTLILEGKVEVITGKEGLVFETGSFSYFGVPALLSSDPIFVPDYTVRQTTDVIILRVRRSLYHAAIQATALEKSKTVVDSNGDDIHDPSVEEQIERVLNFRTVESESQIHQSFDPGPTLMVNPAFEEDTGGGGEGGTTTTSNLSTFYLK